VDDGRPAHPEDLLALGLDLPHPLGDLVHQQRLRLLAGDRRAHEPELLLLAAGDGGRHLDADPVGAAHDCLAGPHVAHRHVADHRPPVALLDDEAAVHLRPVHPQPVTVEPHEGLEVGGRVEVLREDAVDRGRPRRRRSRVHRVGAVDLHPHEDAVQPVRLVRADRHQGPRLVLVLPPQVQALDPVVAPVLEDVVQDSGEDAGVDQMAGHVDGRGVRSGAHERER
jgi:hypothetical protein